MSGSAKLTDEQADWYLDKFGVRYGTVQEAPLQPSRRVRRAMKHGGRRNLSQHDLTVLEAQQATLKALTKKPLEAEVV